MALSQTLSKSLITILALGALYGCSEDPKPQQQPPAESEQEQVQTDEDVSSEGSDTTETQPEAVEEPVAGTTEIKKGLYVYDTDNATFTDCSNNQTYPVAQEGNYYELEATYLALKDEAKQKLLFEVKGEYDMRAPEEGDDVDMLIPSELIGVVHKESCL
ncbi:hypothetical protein [Kangiella taiwanensis]|uniref:NlpE C-terminal OB domain-containing protein n=1 Tax=Kangiella taiwanensis TaxID=1079179 RepID=A0ABP8HPZ3_9GAMM|nr:hypothetical protein [Kangiella taiwanensis]